MDTAATASAMAGVRDAGARFQADWSAAVAAGTAGVGQGPLGARFLAQFAPAERQLNEEAARIARGIQELADAGELAVRDYLAADARGGDAFRQG